MNENVNLQEDDEKLEKYQAESIIGQLGVVQLHLEDMYSGKEAALCISCLENKHLPTIEVLANECLGICRIQPLWKNIAHFARDLRENKLTTEYIGKNNDETMKLRNQARDFRKKLGELLSSQKKANFSGENTMIKDEGVQAPNLAELATVQNPGKTETKHIINKKKGVNWGLILLGLIAGGSYLWDKAKKKKLAEAQVDKGELFPPLPEKITLPTETSSFGSAEERLKGMGIDTGQPGAYQAGESYKGV